MNISKLVKENNDRARLAYEVGALHGFIKFGLPFLSTVKITDQAGFEAAVDAAFKRIERDAKNFVGKDGK